jgi:hypothetical protein
MRQLLRGRLGQVLVAVVIAGAAAAVAIGVSTMGYPTIASYPETTAGAATMEVDPATNIARITLTADAARRLGLKTAAIAESQATGPARLVVPTAAVFYDPAGDTWAFVMRQPFVYMRERITVDAIDGQTALLTAGPPAGTQVVTVGAAELYGTEVGVGEE